LPLAGAFQSYKGSDTTDLNTASTTNNHDVSSEVFKAMKIQAMSFWVVTL